MSRSFIVILLVTLFLCANKNNLLAQTISTSDSIVYQAIVESDLESLRAQLKANKDTFGVPYLHGMMLALNGQTQQAIDSLRKAATDSISPYRNVASMELLNVYAHAGYYKQYCQFASQIHQVAGRYQDAQLFASYPATQINFINHRDSIPFQLRRKSYVVVVMQVNGQPARFIVDTAVHKPLLLVN